ncbi:MAG: hypothetical protein WA700_08970 [Acidobacteriaceae bacterium]
MLASKQPFAGLTLFLSLGIRLPHGGYAEGDITSWIEANANELLVSNLNAVRRIPFATAFSASITHPYDSRTLYVEDLQNIVDMDMAHNSGATLNVDSPGRPLSLTSLWRLGNGLFRVLKRILGVLVRLLGKFVSGQVISFAVGSGGSGMCVGREIVQFCGAVMCALWHGVLLFAMMRNQPDQANPLIELGK